MKKFYNLVLTLVVTGSLLNSVNALDPCSNIALGKSAIASASTSYEPITAAFDGNLTTNWCTPYYSGWVQVDLQSKLTVNTLRLYVNQAITGYTEHEISVSPDNTNWTLVKNLKSNTSNNQLLEFKFSPSLSDVRYIKINTPVSTSWVAWYEIQVYSGSAKPTISKNGLVLSSSSATNNQWYLNGSPISDATSQTYTATASGNYQVGVSSGANCVSMSDIYQISTVTTGINDNTGKDLKMYPNPVNDNVIIEGVTSGNIELINLQGQILKHINITDNKTSMDISGINAGVYSVRISTNNGIVVKKLLKN